MAENEKCSGQENSSLFIKSVNALVRKACFVGLRNRGSIQAIQQILEPKLRDKVVYQPCTTTLISEMLPIKKRRNTKKVGVNIAFDREERRYGAQMISFGVGSRIITLGTHDKTR